MQLVVFVTSELPVSGGGVKAGMAWVLLKHTQSVAGVGSIAYALRGTPLDDEKWHPRHPVSCE